MDNNYYQVLGVSEDASPAIIRIAYEGRLKALAASGMPQAERKAEERLLEQAQVTLSNPAKRSWYDKRLAEAEVAPGGSGRGMLLAAAGMLVVLIAGAAWYSLERTRERERVRLEEARIAVEQEKLRAQAEIDKARLLDGRQAREQDDGFRREVYQGNRSERQGRYQDQQQRIDESRALREQARERALKTHDEREQQRREDRSRRIADDDRRKALAEVERQKRFVLEREREEERIRNERHYRAQRESAAIRAREAAERRSR